MPMHPECRQKDIARYGLLNPAAAIFLPGSSMQAKQHYLDEYYHPEVDEEDRERRSQQFEVLAEEWLERARQAYAAGREFDEPVPAYPQKYEKRHWMDEKIGTVALWIDDLPVPGWVSTVLTILTMILLCWLLIPWFISSTQREWKAMLRRDREYRGDAVCGRCGQGFPGARPAAAPPSAPSSPPQS